MSQLRVQPLLIDPGQGRLTAVATANLFVLKGLEDGRPKTHLQLQKLVFIAHGWYLAELRRPLVNELAQAWHYGPVFESLYRELRPKLKQPILEPLINNEDALANDADIETLLALVYKIYGHWTASQLVEATFQPDTPWSNMYIPFMNISIPNHLILEHYTNLSDRKVLY